MAVFTKPLVTHYPFADQPTIYLSIVVLEIQAEAVAVAVAFVLTGAQVLRSLNSNIESLRITKEST